MYEKYACDQMLRRWISHVSHTPHHSHRDAATVETSDSIQLYRCRPYPGRNERVKSKRDRATTEEKKNDRSHSVPGCDDEIHFVLSILKFKIIQEKCCNYRLTKLLLFIVPLAYLVSNSNRHNGAHASKRFHVHAYDITFSIVAKSQIAHQAHRDGYVNGMAHTV